MVSDRVQVPAASAARRLYRHVPIRVRHRLRPTLQRYLGEQVTLRHLDIGWAEAAAPPRTKPVVIESPPELYIPKRLVEEGLGGYEPYSLDMFMALVEHTGRGTVLDVGANVGLYGLLAAAQGARKVYCFEPTPRIAAAARRSGRVSHHKLDVVEAALGEELGTATLYLSNRTDSSNSLNPGFRSSSHQLTVPVNTLDAFCAERKIIPSVIKIDTETTEPSVLRGGRGVLIRNRPWILVEVLKGRGDGELNEVMDGLGYTYYHLDRPGPIEPSTRIVGTDGNAFMYLLAPAPVSNALWQSMNAWRQRLQDATCVDSLVSVPRYRLKPTLFPCP